MLGLCVFSRRRHEEKWWALNLILSICYGSSFKFHKSENGMIGHTSGVWCAGIGFSITFIKMFAGAGNKWLNRHMLWMFLLQGWVDWGRMHQWIEHTNEIKKNVVPLKRTIVTSMWAEYVPAHEESELIMFRKLHEVKEQA